MKKILLVKRTNKSSNEGKEATVYFCRRRKKETKEDLYSARLRDPRHHETLFINPNFFQTKSIKEELRNTVRDFNDLVEKVTGSNFYSVTLRYGITKIAADFEYQFRKFRSFAANNELFPEILEKFEEIRAIELRKSLTWKESTGRFSFQKAIFEERLKNLSPVSILLLLLYKAFSDKPNNDISHEPALTGLSDSRAGRLINCSRKTIAKHREELEQNRCITSCLVKNRYRKIVIRTKI